MTSSKSEPPITAAALADGYHDLLRRVAELTEDIAARDTFIAVAGHELRNPMTAMLGQITILLSAVKADKYSREQVEQRLERIQQTIRRYMKRAAVLLDVTRITTQKFQLDPAACDLAALVRDVVDDFAEAAQHSGVTLELTAPDTLPGLWDRLAVEQIIDNLLSNAIKYGERAPVEVTLSTTKQYVQIYVRDHGKGIPAYDRTRVFGRFERVLGQNEYRSGFGVGLWVVGQLVQAMSGTMRIEDAPGGGTLFIVTLPLHTEEDTGD